MKNYLLACLFVGMTFCNGCSSSPIIDTVVQKAPPVAIPSIAPLNLAPMQWQVLNSADLQALATKMKGKDYVLFGLDTNNYQNSI